MDIDALRHYCLAFPHTTENVQWGDNLCLRVAGKLFAIASLDASSTRLAFKCSPENFAELCERPGVRPAPYMARAQWVALEQLNTLPDSELRDLLVEAYRLVWERIPKKRRDALHSNAEVPRRHRSTAATKKAMPSRKKSASSKERSAKAGKMR